MFKVQDVITHRRQEKGFSCAAAAVAILLGEDESKIRLLIKTKSTGTRMSNIQTFFKLYGIPSNFISINENYFNLLENLIRLSYKFPIISSATYLSRNQKIGRSITRHHAAVIADGMVYDPAENKEMSLEAYISTFNKELIFRCLIIIDHERPNYLKNSSERY